MNFPPLSIDDLESLFVAPDAKKTVRRYMEQGQGRKAKKRRVEEDETPFTPLDEEMIQFCFNQMTYDEFTATAMRTLLTAIFGEGLHWSRTNVALPDDKSRELSEIWRPFGEDVIRSLYKWGIVVAILVPDKRVHKRPVVLDLYKDYQLWVRANSVTRDREYQIMKRNAPPPNPDEPDQTHYYIWRVHPPDTDGTIHSILSCMKARSEERQQLRRFNASACELLSKPGIVIERDDIRDRDVDNRAEANRIKLTEASQHKISGTDDELAQEGMSGILADKRYAPGKKRHELVSLDDRPVGRSLTQRNKDFLELSRSRRGKVAELDAIMSRLFKETTEPIDFDQFDPNDMERRVYRMKDSHTWKLTNDVKAPSHYEFSEQTYVYLVASNIGIPVASFHQIDVRYKQDREAIAKDLDRSATVWGSIFLDIARDLLNEIYGQLHSLHGLALEELRRRAELENKLITRKERRLRLEALESLKQQLNVDRMLNDWQLDQFQEILRARMTEHQEEEEEEDNKKENIPQLEYTKQYNRITKEINAMTEMLKAQSERPDDRKLEAIRQDTEELLAQEFKEFDSLVRSAVYNQGSRFQGGGSFLKIDPVSGAIVATLNKANLEIDLGLIRRINQEKSDKKAEESHERMAKMVVAFQKQNEYDILPGGVVQHKKFHLNGEKLFNHKNLHLLYELLDMTPKTSMLSEVQVAKTVKKDFKFWARNSLLSPLTPSPTRRALLRMIERRDRNRRRVSDLETTVRAFLHSCGISPVFKDMCKVASTVHTAFSGSKRKRKRKQKTDEKEQAAAAASSGTDDEGDDNAGGEKEEEASPEFGTFYLSRLAHSGSYDASS